MCDNRRDPYHVSLGHRYTPCALLTTVKPYGLVSGQDTGLELVPTSVSSQNRSLWAQVDVLIFVQIDLKSSIHTELVVIDMNLVGSTGSEAGLERRK